MNKGLSDAQGNTSVRLMEMMETIQELRMAFNQEIETERDSR